MFINNTKMTCKGICTRYKAQKPVGTGRYASGQRRCQICEIFIKWEGLWCPCCGYRLRTKPRNLKYKAKLRARVEASAAEARANAAKLASKSKKSKSGSSTAASAAGSRTKAARKKPAAKKTDDAPAREEKPTKGKKKPCLYCDRTFVYPQRHAKICKNNPAVANASGK